MHHNKLQLLQTREKWVSSLQNTQKNSISPSSIQVNGCDIPLFTSVRHLSLIFDQTFSFQQHVSHTGLACYPELHQISSVTTSPMMFSKLSSVPSFCLILITVIHSSQGAPKSDLYTSESSKQCCPPQLLFSQVWPCISDSTCFTLASCGVLHSLFLPLNHWTTKPLPISVISPSCMFRLIDCLSADAWLHCLAPAHLESSGQRAFFYQSPLLWDKSTLLSVRRCSSIASFKSAIKTHLFSSELWMPCPSAPGCVPVVLWVYLWVSVGRFEKDGEWSVAVCLCN